MKKNVLLTIMMASMAAAPSFANIGSRKAEVESKAHDLAILASITDVAVKTREGMQDKLNELVQIQDPNNVKSISEIDKEIKDTQAALSALSPETTTPAE
jgi:hypothetical protein